jgi:drug/metabolite transporter (DMT)-like permease
MTKSGEKGEKETKWMITILVLSIFAASANSLLYKAALNAFSSPTTNYGFFVSQFSLLLYIGQAAVVSMFVGWRNPQTFTDVYNTPHSIFIIMGGLDSGSSTLGAIAGAYCPGEMQTLLNQLVIPLTMLGALLFLGSHFAGYQVSGSALILFGAGFASSGYLFNSDTGPDASGQSMATSAAITLYVVSVIPSAVSNIYKEKMMKELDMNEVHTSTIVSFWQVVIGFAFLPLMALPMLGKYAPEFLVVGSLDSYSELCYLQNNS